MAAGGRQREKTGYDSYKDKRAGVRDNREEKDNKAFSADFYYGLLGICWHYNINITKHMIKQLLTSFDCSLT